jgi:hypothetical protein
MSAVFLDKKQIHEGVKFNFTNWCIAAFPILGRDRLKTQGRNNQHC